MTESPSPPAPVTELPGERRAYVLEAGSGRAHLLLGQVARTLVGAEESGDALSVLLACGPSGPPIPLHVHEEEQDIFFCVRGRMVVWAGEEARILGPGDLASVPQGVLHAYQFLQHDTRFLGPVVPAGWDRFFDLVGTPYPGPAYPQVDPSPPPFAKFGEAEARFRMKYRPDLPYAEPTDGADDVLPGAYAPYFLKAGEGPRHTLFGQTCFELVTGAESNGRVGMVVVEGPAGPRTPAHVHDATHEVIICLEGAMRVWTDGDVHPLVGGDTVSIPAGAVHAYALDAHVTRFTSMNAPGGIERLFALAGEPAEHRIFPPSPAPLPDVDRLADAGASIDTRFVDG